MLNYTNISASQYIKTYGMFCNRVCDGIEVAPKRNNNLNDFMRNFANLLRLPRPSKKNTFLYKTITNTVTLMKNKAGEKDISFQLKLSHTR